MKKMLCMLAGLLTFVAQPSFADPDTRTKVDMPDMMKAHMLGGMRDHLLALNEIQSALAKRDTDKAGDIAETRLGMSSMVSHDASHMAPFMPEEMKSIGIAMHHAASRFAMTVKEGDMSRSLDALSEVTGQCVACHMSYRVN